MLNIIGNLYLMNFDFPLLRSLHFEYDLLFCVFNDGIFMPHRAFHLGLVWLVRGDSFNCLVFNFFLRTVFSSSSRLVRYTDKYMESSKHDWRLSVTATSLQFCP